MTPEQQEIAEFMDQVNESIRSIIASIQALHERVTALENADE